MVCKGWAIAVLMLGACADDDSGGGPTALELCLGTPTFVAYRDGSGPWQTTTPDAEGFHQFTVVDDYEFVSVRVYDGGLVFAWASRSTVRESARLRAGAQLACPLRDANTVTVSGQLAQAGVIWIDSRSAGVGAPGPFTIQVRPGVHDLWATTSSADGGKVLLRRDQSITGATTLPAIDIDAEGLTFIPVPVTVSGLAASDTTATSVYLLHKPDNDFVSVSDRSGMTAAVVPATLLTSGYEQWISVSAGNRGADLRFSGGMPTAEIPPALTGVTFARTDGVSAAWGTLQTSYTYTQLSTSTSSLIQYVAASRGWNEKHGATSIAFDSSVPGLDPAWQLGPTQQFDSAFTVSVDTEDSYQWTSATTDETQTPRRLGLPPGLALDLHDLRAARR